MKKICFSAILIFLVQCIVAQSQSAEQKRDMAFYNATHTWFSAWKLVCSDLYKIEKLRPVEFVFFDDKYVYSTSFTTIKNGLVVKGCNLMNLSFTWKKALHNDSIILPDKSVVPIGLMSFAAEIPDKKNTSFFVMPLPSFWEKSGTTSKELGLQNLITGVFIHEFSHSQQMQNFGKSITLFEKQNDFGVPFSDDIVQNIFAKDSNYLTLYKQEVQSFYKATQTQTLDKNAAREGLKLMTGRQDEYFKGPLLNLKEIDNFFLTMEGLGQYSMYLWLTHPKGGHIKKEIAVEGIRRNRKWWSQDEGFALFLIMDKLTTPATWAKNMFGYKTVSIITLLSQQLH